MKRYRLKKDLPTFKAGDEFRLEDSGLWKDKGEQAPILAYSAQTLEKFPNILTNWFAEIPEQPKTVWDLQEHDVCYVIQAGLEFAYASEANWDSSWKPKREISDIFLTREECEREIARRKAKAILERDVNGFKVKPNNGDFYYVYYDVYTRRLRVGRWNTDYSGSELAQLINFATRDDAEASIKSHEKEWLTYLGVEE